MHVLLLLALFLPLLVLVPFLEGSQLAVLDSIRLVLHNHALFQRLPAGVGAGEDQQTAPVEVDELGGHQEHLLGDLEL